MCSDDGNAVILMVGKAVVLAVEETEVVVAVEVAKVVVEEANEGRGSIGH